MNTTISLLKTLYSGNKKMFVIALLIIAAFVIVGCSAQGGSAPPTGPIGGGCG